MYLCVFLIRVVLQSESLVLLLVPGSRTEGGMVGRLARDPGLRI